MSINELDWQHINYSKLPSDLQDGMRNYIEHGLEPGGFLTAVLENNLRRAIAKADSVNRVVLPTIVQWIYSECPSSIRGSEEAVKQWIKQNDKKP